MDEPLPGILGEIAEVAGRDAALAIALVRGGRIIYIPTPSRLAPDHWIVQICGADAARAIAERLGGGEILLPLGPTGSRADTVALIKTGIARGLSNAAVAALARVTIRTVKRHRATARAAENDNQLMLF